MDSKKFEELYAAIETTVEAFIGHLETGAIKEQLVETLYEHNIRTIKKYAIGCIEHAGSPILSCPWESAAGDELADLLIYINIPKWRRAVEAARSDPKPEPGPVTCEHCGRPEDPDRCTCPCQNDE